MAVAAAAAGGGGVVVVVVVAAAAEAAVVGVAVGVTATSIKISKKSQKHTGITQTVVFGMLRGHHHQHVKVAPETSRRFEVPLLPSKVHGIGETLFRKKGSRFRV